MRVFTNYQNFLKQIEVVKALDYKPRLLLHSCCAPCSTSVIERLKDYFEITIFYYNPNINDINEFNLRATEQEKLCNILGVGFILPNFDIQDFEGEIQGLEREIEGGARCEKCFTLRLKKTAEFAKQKGYDYFATTLTVSPLKNCNLINSIGEKLQEQLGVNYLPSDFKKKGGYLRSIELSKQYELYRQNYCGCSYSKMARG